MMITKSRNRSPKLLLRLSSLQNGSNLSYHKLPKNLVISLSILKLDGSSFGVDVSRNATVAGIKLALEEVFSLLPEEDQCNVSCFNFFNIFQLTMGKKAVPRSSMFLAGSNAHEDGSFNYLDDEGDGFLDETQVGG